jgi:ribosomal protein L10
VKVSITETSENEKARVKLEVAKKRAAVTAAQKTHDNHRRWYRNRLDEFIEGQVN